MPGPADDMSRLRHSVICRTRSADEPRPRSTEALERRLLRTAAPDDGERVTLQLGDHRVVLEHSADGVRVQLAGVEVHFTHRQAELLAAALLASAPPRTRRATFRSWP